MYRDNPLNKVLVELFWMAHCVIVVFSYKGIWYNIKTIVLITCSVLVGLSSFIIIFGIIPLSRYLLSVNYTVNPKLTFFLFSLSCDLLFTKKC